jgi:predicted MFS family arabinose efflux permease
MNPWRGLRGLPRASFASAGATLVQRAGSMVRPFLVLYFTERLGFGDAVAGAMMACYGATAIVAALLAGWLSDRFGAALVFRGALFAQAAVLLCYPAASTPPAAAAATALLAFAGELGRPAAMALLTDAVAPEQRKQAFVLMRLAINLGLSLGPAAGGFLFPWSPLALFVVDGGANLAAGAVLLVVRLPRGALDGHEGARGSWLDLLRDRALLTFLAATLLQTIVFFQADSTMARFMTRDLGLETGVYGLMFTINTAMIVLLEVELNAQLAHWTHRRSLAVGGVLTAAGFGALALVSGWIGVALTVVVWTIGEMIAMPAMGAWLADAAPPGRRGAYLSVLSLAFGGGIALGPLIGLPLLDRAGPPLVRAGGGATGLAGAAIYLGIPRRGPPAGATAMPDCRPLAREPARDDAR